MNPVTGIWDVLDISTRKKSLDFRVILRAKRIATVHGRKTDTELNKHVFKTLQTFKSEREK